MEDTKLDLIVMNGMDRQVIKLSRKEHSGKRFRRWVTKQLSATTVLQLIMKAVIKDVTINGNA